MCKTPVGLKSATRVLRSQPPFHIPPLHSCFHRINLLCNHPISFQPLSYWHAVQDRASRNAFLLSALIRVRTGHVCKEEGLPLRPKNRQSHLIAGARVCECSLCAVPSDVYEQGMSTECINSSKEASETLCSVTVSYLQGLHVSKGFWIC